MTDRSPAELDALASTVLDGEATAEELAALRSDEAVMARVRTFRELQDAHRGLGHVEAGASGGADSRIAAALAAAGATDEHDRPTDERTTQPAQQLPDGVVGFDTARGRARADGARTPRLGLVAGVAAAIVVLLVSGIVVARDRSGDSTAAGPVATTAHASRPDGSRASGDLRRSDEAPPTSSLAPASLPAPESPAAPLTLPPPSPLAVTGGGPLMDFHLYIGEFPDVASLLATVRAAPGKLVALTGEPLACSGEAPGADGPTGARASVGRRDVFVVRKGEVITLRDPDTCKVLLR